MSQKIKVILKSVLVLALFALSIQIFAAGYSAPLTSPTGGDINPPINAGTVPQQKDGAFAVNGFKSFTTAVFDGKVGIGTGEVTATIPAAKLHVSAENLGVQLRLERTGDTPGIVDMGAWNGDLAIYPGGYTANNGGVAIGANDAGTAKLYVNGNVDALGTIKSISSDYTAAFILKNNTASSVLSPNLVFSDTVGQNMYIRKSGLGLAIFGTGNTTGPNNNFLGGVGIKSYINNGANFGIGTIEPAEKLDVVGNIKFSGALMPGGLAGTAGQVLQSNGAGVPTWVTPSAVVASQWTTNGTNIYYNAGGDVGIGNTNPTAKLELTDTSGETSFLGNTVNSGILKISGGTINNYSTISFRYSLNSTPIAKIAMLPTASGSELHFGTSNNFASGITSDALVIKGSGNVGIGTTAPLSKLFVAGGSSGSGTGANNAYYALGAQSIAANDSIYSYGAICTNNSVGNCTGSDGTVIGIVNVNAKNNIPNVGDILFNGGNVGIGTGTTAPNAKLEVNGKINTTGGLSVRNKNTGPNVMNQIISESDKATVQLDVFSSGFVSGSNGDIAIPNGALLDASGAGGLNIVAYNNSSLTPEGDIRFYTGGNMSNSLRMIIDATGNVKSFSGFKFPDDTIQKTAATPSGRLYYKGSLDYAVPIKWIVPNGVTKIWVTAVAGGGGGGGGGYAGSGSFNGGPGGGGGGGGFIFKREITVTEGDWIQIYSGGGGSGGLATRNGYSGVKAGVYVTNSSTSVFALGGSGGTAGGTGGNNPPAPGSGGSGGSVTSGVDGIDGESGTDGISGTSSTGEVVGKGGLTFFSGTNGSGFGVGASGGIHAGTGANGKSGYVLLEW
ncbi:MAG: hypothetical protein WCS86_01975 [Candidatus Paceibacterota bacterium]